MNLDEVADMEFPVVMRGYAREEVQAFLATVADELAERDARISRLEAAFERLPVESAPAAAPSTASTAAVDRATLLRQLGDEAVSVLTAADQSAERIKANAEASTERVRHDLRSLGSSLGDVHQLLGELVLMVQGLCDSETLEPPEEIRIPDAVVGGDVPGNEVRTILGEVLGLDSESSGEPHSSELAN
ncbi:MAG: DivIVA domain-containing protein [Acidimicrobiia bacterium]